MGVVSSIDLSSDCAKLPQIDMSSKDEVPVRTGYPLQGNAGAIDPPNEVEISDREIDTHKIGTTEVIRQSQLVLHFS
jgi:hypothetical protein